MDSGTQKKNPTWILSSGFIILSTCTFVALATPQISRSGHFAKRAVALSEEATLAIALHDFQDDYNRFPSTKEGLQALITPPPGSTNKLRNTYLIRKKLPQDPWGNPYQYQSQKQPETFTITATPTTGTKTPVITTGP